MRRGSGRGHVLAIALALMVALVLSACADGGSKVAKPIAPKLAPPAIAKAGVLRVAVDAAYPPFAAKEASGFAGLDVDVASALASRLGLRVEFVDVPVASLGSALREKRVDVAFGGLQMTDAALSDVTVATSYLSDAPVLFSREASAVPDGLQRLRIGVQKDSPAYWLVRAKTGEEALVVSDTLREAFDRLAAGDVDAVAGDAIVGGYILREYQTLRMTTQLADAAPLAVLVPQDAEAVESAVRDEMDVLAAGGVLDAIRGKWLGGLSPLKLATAPDAPSPDTAAPSLVNVTASSTPTPSPVVDTSAVTTP